MNRRHSDTHVDDLAVDMRSFLAPDLRSGVPVPAVSPY